MSHLHPQARTTPLVRAEIRASQDSIAVLSRRYNLTQATVRKWKGRDAPTDLSHRPHKLCTTLSPAQEAVVMELRRLLPLDDLLVITREFIHADVSRSALNRCLVRHGVGNLGALRAELNPPDEPTDKPAKTFKAYEPGFIHIDIKYLPQMPDEHQRRYLLALPVRGHRSRHALGAYRYLRQPERGQRCGLPAARAQGCTDDHHQGADRQRHAIHRSLHQQGPRAHGRHRFDVHCKALGIEHRLCPPRHPQTNGMVERFNARVGEVIAQTRFKTGAELASTLLAYVQTYNHQIPQRALDHHTPIQALKLWRDRAPHLFPNSVQDLPGLGKRRSPPHPALCELDVWHTAPTVVPLRTL